MHVPHRVNAVDLHRRMRASPTSRSGREVPVPRAHKLTRTLSHPSRNTGVLPLVVPRPADVVHPAASGTGRSSACGDDDPSTRRSVAVTSTSSSSLAVPLARSGGNGRGMAEQKAAISSKHISDKEYLHKLVGR